MLFTANLNIRALCREGQLMEALHILSSTHNPSVDCSTYLQVVHTCITKKAFSEGKLVHSFIIDRGLTFTAATFFQNKLINMYVKCGSLMDARRVFDHMREADIFSWNMMISAYRRREFPQEALTLFCRMLQTATKPDQFVFASILPACAELGALEQGMQIHERIIESGFLLDVVIGSALVDMYAKCGSIQKARELFDKMPQRDVVSWNGMITGYAQNGVLDEALRLFKNMPQPNLVSWNAVIGGYVQNGLSEEALEIFRQMQQTGVEPDHFTFASILSACAKMGSLKKGMEFLRSIIESRFSSNVMVVNALLDMFGKCGSMQKARDLFDKLHHPNVVSWTAMITGYAQNGFLDEALKFFEEMPEPNVVSWNAIIAGFAQTGFVEKALEIFQQMQQSSVQADQFTFASVLQACAKIGAMKQGMEIHQRIVENGFLSNAVVANGLIDMYAKCGNIQKAHKLFDKMHHPDMISWTAMIAGCAQSGLLDEASRFFQQMPQPNVVAWNAIIAGYAQNGLVEKALQNLKQLQQTGVRPDQFTFASILPACAKMGALEQGMELHQRIIKSGFLSNVIVANALIDMYSKCGSIQKSHELFNKMDHPNVVSWTAMIAGYAMQGYGKDALKLFTLMTHSGTYPDRVSFVCVLFACSHIGLVDEGCKYFSDMSDSYSIVPTMDHYVCMVDLLGRAGYLEEALKFIIKIPIKPDVVMWMCLLGACRSHKNTELGEFLATLLFELDPKKCCTISSSVRHLCRSGKVGSTSKVK